MKWKNVKESCGLQRGCLLQKAHRLRGDQGITVRREVKEWGIGLALGTPGGGYLRRGGGRNSLSGWISPRRGRKDRGNTILDWEQ